LQAIAQSLLIANVDALHAGTAPRGSEELIAALRAVAADTRLEPAFVALALTPPGEADLAREIGENVDPEAIYRARKALRGAIGRALAPVLTQTYQRMTVPGPYSPDAAAAGRRALRNVCLDLLAATGDGGAIGRAEAQYNDADNMTDRFAALAVLSQHDNPARERALADFYRRYAADALIVDKWLALQAMIPDASTLDRVRGLTRHAAFSMVNPNRVRALIGSFAQANPVQFNRPDGLGYEFVADNVLALDPKNQQVAARLATAFRSWRTMEAGRRARAQAALKRIGHAPGLSRDVGDIVERALG
jgi:aminopeptidase N